MHESKITCLEVPHTQHIYCPFCGQHSLNPDANDFDEHFAICDHLLFVGHDEGFEYRSHRFDVAAGIVEVDDDDIDFPDGGLDGLTSSISVQGAVKFASYVPAPSFFGTYVGFAVLED